MARLQILELPEGSGGDRPFALVIDQYVALDVGPTLLREPIPQRYQSIAERVGARAVLVFEETIYIPANEPLPLSEDATAAQIIDAHEQTRLDLCEALQLPQGTTWRNLVNHARGARNGRDVRAAALERLRNLPTHPEIMDARHEQPQGYLQGYSVAISDAQQAAHTPTTEGGD